MGGALRFRRCILHGRTSSHTPLLSSITYTPLPEPTRRIQPMIDIEIVANTTQAIGGSLWHGVKGFRNSPYGERRIGALTAIKARAPVLGGNFGVWGGLFSTFDCAVKGIRKKEDPYNASMSTPICRKEEWVDWDEMREEKAGTLG